VIGPGAIETFCLNDEQRALLPQGCGWARIYGPDGSELCEAEDAGGSYAEIDLEQFAGEGWSRSGRALFAGPDVLSVQFDPRNHTPVHRIGIDGRLDVNTRSRVENFRLRQAAEQERQASSGSEQNSLNNPFWLKNRSQQSSHKLRVAR
jgi:aliphatic nitrilase